MTLTLVSSSSPYCTPQQFINRYDFRSIGKLLSDDGLTTLNQAQVLASTVLNELLMSNSGIVESATLRGGRYDVVDLRLLQSPVMTNDGQWLASLVAKMTIWDVYCRRPHIDQPMAPAIYKEAQAMLQALEGGDMIFAFQETMDSSRIEHLRLNDYQQFVKGGATTILRRYFGRRSGQDVSNFSP